MKVRQKEPTQTKMKGESAVRWLGGGRGGGWLYLLSTKQPNQREEDIPISNSQIKQALIKILLSFTILQITSANFIS